MQTGTLTVAGTLLLSFLASSATISQFNTAVPRIAVKISSMTVKFRKYLIVKDDWRGKGLCSFCVNIPAQFCDSCLGAIS